MMPKYHIFYGALFSLFIYFLFEITFLETTLLFLSSFLIDLDHYFRYITKTKNINPLKFWSWSLKNKEKKEKIKNLKNYKTPFFAFHGIEFILILIFLTYYFNILIFVLIGVLFHLFLDYVLIFYKNYPFNKFSQLYNLINNKNKESFDD